jgi:fructokinase
MSTKLARSLKLFYCYAHEDKVLRNELDKHLSDLKREYQIVSWSDGEIIPGTEWQKELINKTGEPIQRKVYGGVEGGGTKFNCMIGTDPYHVLATQTFPTTDPKRTLDEVTQFFRQELRGYELAAIGVGSFGPIDLNPGSATYGYITTTPKPSWEYTNIVGILKDRLQVPVAFDTDVNAAALGEYRWGAAQGCDPSIYITVGTGIGGGLYVNGAPLHGLIHPEMGHLQLPRLDGDDFPSICPYHDHCWEGLASGSAIAARTRGKPAQHLPPDNPVWETEAQYLAMGITNIIYIASPHRIILGGGVMRQEHLFPRIREYVKKLLNGYLHHAALQEDIESFIVPPKLGSKSGLFGALELARIAEAKHVT